MPEKDKLEYFIVEGGHDGDPDPEETGRIRVRQMGKHGKNVKTEHLPFNQTLKSSGNEFKRPPAPGTIMTGYVPRGADHTGYAHLIGAFSTKQESGASVPGNTTLPFLDKAQNMELNIRLPPNIKSILDQNRTGLEKFKKEIEEKGEKFKQATLRGLPSDGAIFALSGVRNTPLKNISTAIDKVADQMSSSKLSALSGLVSSLDLNSLINQLISQLNLPSQLVDTLQSFVKTASGEINAVSPPGGASLGNLINQEKFLIKALEVMKDVKTTGQLLQAIQTLQHPDTLADTLSDIGNIAIESDSIFGKIKQELNSKGELVPVANDFIDNIKNALSSLLGSIPGTGIDGDTFFTSEGTPIQDLIERMKDTAKATELKQAVEKVSSSMNARKKKQRTDNNSAGKGATQDIVFKAKQLVARDGRIVPFKPTDKSGSSGSQVSTGTPETPTSNSSNTVNSAAFGLLANAAYDRANAAYNLATSAYETANSGVGSQIGGNTSNTANAALALAQTAFNQANTAYNVAIGAYSTINSESGRLTSAFAKANTVGNDSSNASNIAIGAFDKANAEGSRLTSAYATLNSESTRLTSAYATINAESTRLTSAFDKANSGETIAIAAFSKANTVGNDSSNASNIAVGAYTNANLARNNSNTAYLVGIGAFGKANTEESRLTSAYGTINAESTRLTSAFDKANSGETIAIAAFAKANLADINASNAANVAVGAYTNANLARNNSNTAYNTGVGAFTKANSEATRLTSAYATVNSESIRLTSAFAIANTALAKANGTWSDSGSFTPRANALVGTLGANTTTGYAKRLDQEMVYVSMRVDITDKGTINSNTSLLRVSLPFTSHTDNFQQHIMGRAVLNSGAAFIIAGHINANNDYAIIAKDDNASPIANGTFHLSGMIRTTPSTL